MQTIATEVFDAKKEKLKTEIEDECEYQVYIQSEEIEKTFEKFKSQLKKRAETMDIKKIIKEQCKETLKVEIMRMKTEMDDLKDENNTLKTENKKIRRKLEELEFETKSNADRKELSLNQKNKGAATEKPLFVVQGCLEMHLEDLTTKTDEIEQHQLERNVRVVGLPD